jgi:subtilisin family serine protease
VSYVSLPPYRVALASSVKSVGERLDWGLKAYGIPSIWSRSQGEGAVVAVIDSGVAHHPDLESAVTDRRNFTLDAESSDTLGHGTHVAGIIGARSGMKGIAPACTILSLKVLGHSGTGDNTWVAQAIQQAVESKADIICMSLGSPKADSQIHHAVRAAHAAGLIVVCAAGNDGSAVNYPAAFQETIGVGAVDKDGKACEYSSRGKEIAVAAPGSDITSCWIDNGYATISGTSMAAPFVAGTLALYVSSARKNGKKVNHADVMEALAKTCTDAGDAGRDPLYGWGLIDPHKLVNYSPSDSRDGVTLWIPGARVL